MSTLENMAIVNPGAAQVMLQPGFFRPVHKFGYCASVGSLAYETVWTSGGTYPWRAAAGEIFIASTAAGDTEDMLVWGVKADYSEHVVRVTLTGQTEVSLGSEFLNIHRGRCLGACTGEIWAGTGTFTLGVPAVKLLHIDDSEVNGTDNDGSTLMALYTVPKDSYAHLIQVYYTAKSDSIVALRVRKPGYPWWVMDPIVSQGNELRPQPFLPVTGPGKDETGSRIYYEEGTQFEIRAKSNTGTDSITAYFDLLLRKKDLSTEYYEVT